MNCKDSLLSMSRSYIVVPRDVPPENFKSVPETLRVKKTPGLCLARSLLLLTLVLCLAAGAVSGIYLAYEGYRSRARPQPVLLENHQFVGDQPREVIDHHEELYLAVQLESNVTVYRRQKSDPCEKSPCLNGGSCESHDNVFTCYCPPGYLGDLCNTSQGRGSVRLGRQSHLTFSSSLLTRDSIASLRLSFRPSHTDTGLILLTGNFSVRLSDGHMVVSYGASHYQYVGVSLAWHDLTVSTYHGDMMVQLDDSSPLTASLAPPPGHTVLGHLLCLGDCQGDSSGARACFRDLRFGHQTLSFISEQESLLKDFKDVEQCLESED